MVHKTKVEKYNGTLQELAEDICNMRYDALAEFFKQLSVKLEKDSEADYNRNRFKLSLELFNAYSNLFISYKSIDRAWKICKKHMNSAKE